MYSQCVKYLLLFTERTLSALLTRARENERFSCLSCCSAKCPGVCKYWPVSQYGTFNCHCLSDSNRYLGFFKRESFLFFWLSVNTHCQLVFLFFLLPSAVNQTIDFIRFLLLTFFLSLRKISIK